MFGVFLARQCFFFRAPFLVPPGGGGFFSPSETGGLANSSGKNFWQKKPLAPGKKILLEGETVFFKGGPEFKGDLGAAHLYADGFGEYLIRLDDLPAPATKTGAQSK